MKIRLSQLSTEERSEIKALMESMNNPGVGDKEGLFSNLEN